MKLADVILPEAIIPELGANDRDGVVREMVAALAGCLKLGDNVVGLVAEAVIERERQGSTAFGKGVAVPHAKHLAIPGVCGAIARSTPGVEFRSLDREPVYLIVLLLSSPDCHDEHLAALERVFRFAREGNFRRFIMQAEDAAEIWSLIAEADAMLGG
jgi:mannitol/fructose-specific phosphotransferase system IIA component (Ntr-type)